MRGLADAPGSLMGSYQKSLSWPLMANKKPKKFIYIMNNKLIAQLKFVFMGSTPIKMMLLIVYEAEAAMECGDCGDFAKGGNLP